LGQPALRFTDQTTFWPLLRAVRKIPNWPVPPPWSTKNGTAPRILVYPLSAIAILDAPNTMREETKVYSSLFELVQIVCIDEDTVPSFLEEQQQ
jgi:hypothetical protein